MIRRCETCEVDEDTTTGTCWSCGRPWTTLGSVLHSKAGQGASRRGGLPAEERAAMLAAGYRGLL